MCCSEAIARIFMFVANFVFLLVGVALFALGVFYKVHYTQITESIPQEYQVLQYVPILAIIVGAIIFVISFLGCCGTLKSSICMLKTYAGILIVIFLAQVAIGIFGLVQIKNSDDLRRQVDITINNLFDNYYSGKTGVVDFIQQNLKCCGTYSPAYWTSKGQSIPQSCYESTFPFTQGCTDAVYNFLHSSVRYIAIAAIAISVTEILGAILAIGLSNCIISGATW
ncbi:23 kDa integral membrane protein-like [Anthonomus grandis grandis]|uniref:23 kDa integral membrane protein-like n=1 Tax=Anthonomus grandis grandis TaxID=2921223 RepID=UPI002165B73C|nr:23 kDa integral membrane protein-like [Anthonomus grandis grandis]